VELAAIAGAAFEAHGFHHGIDGGVHSSSRCT